MSFFTARPAAHRPSLLRRLLAFGFLIVGSGASFAQGGPPMVTDDPGTPGDGRWEINLGKIATRTQPGWLIEAIDADINYGWGDRVQLKFDTPWNVAPHGSSLTNGLGTSLFGVKWRFLGGEAGDGGPGGEGDKGDAWSASTYPQLGVNLNPGSAHRGLANPGKSLLLPLEAAGHLGALDVDAELGRGLVEQGEDEWIAGLILGHFFTGDFEAMFESRARVSHAGTETLLNLGARWSLSPGLSLMAAAGREAGAYSPGRVGAIYYLGVQIRR